MEKCKGCGVELLEGTVFCPYCGSQVEKEQAPVEVINNYEGNNDYFVPKKEKKVFKVFALIGMIFGFVNIGSLVLSIITLGIPELAYVIAILGSELSIPGFVFSIIGKKSHTNHGKAIFGFIANLICMILLFIIAFIAIIMSGTSGSGNYGDILM